MAVQMHLGIGDHFDNYDRAGGPGVALFRLRVGLTIDQGTRVAVHGYTANSSASWAAEHRQHQAAVRCGRVGPCVFERAEAGARLLVRLPPAFLDNRNNCASRLFIIIGKGSCPSQFDTAPRQAQKINKSSFTHWNRYNAPASPCLRRGERAALARKGSLVRKRVKASFDPKTFLAKVGEGKTISKYQKDQIVFSQGQVADAVFYIQQGKIKLTVVSEQGKEAVVAVLGPGHFFGEGCLNGHPLRIATTRAMDECVVTRLEKATMIATIHNEPDFSELFMSYLLTRNTRIEEDLIDQLFNSSEKRLARLLLLLANFGKEGRPEPIVGTFSQETLAEMIGTTRSRVSFFMNKFRKLGFIEYNGKLEVHNSLLNVVLYDQPAIKSDASTST